MKTVIIVSKCQRVTKIDYRQGVYEFHFKGVCSGEVITKVMLRAPFHFLIKSNEEYLMHVQIQGFDHGTLYGEIIKVKRLEDCWDKS